MLKVRYVALKTRPLVGFFGGRISGGRRSAGARTGGACENLMRPGPGPGRKQERRGTWSTLVRSCPQTPIISFSIPIFYFTWSETLLLFRPLPNPFFSSNIILVNINSFFFQVVLYEIVPVIIGNIRRHQKVSDIAKSVCFGGD